MKVVLEILKKRDDVFRALNNGKKKYIGSKNDGHK